MLATTAFKLQVHVTVSASAIYNEWNSKLDKILACYKLPGSKF